MFSYKREQERQADLLSMAYLKASPYDPRCFSDIWDRIMGEADASARGRKQRSSRYDRVAFFDTHPTSLERATYLRETAAAMGVLGEEFGSRYAAAIVAWRPIFLADQIKLNDFEGTDYLLTELAGPAWSADLLFARGELYRSRGNPRDLVSAVTFYQGAIVRDPRKRRCVSRAGPRTVARPGSRCGGDVAHLYLSMNPNASDSTMISTLIQ